MVNARLTNIGQIVGNAWLQLKQLDVTAVAQPQHREDNHAQLRRKTVYRPHLVTPICCSLSCQGTMP